MKKQKEILDKWSWINEKLKIMEKQNRILGHSKVLLSQSEKLYDSLEYYNLNQITPSFEQYQRFHIDDFEDCDALEQLKRLLEVTVSAYYCYPCHYFNKECDVCPISSGANCSIEFINFAKYLAALYSDQLMLAEAMEGVQCQVNIL